VQFSNSSLLFNIVQQTKQLNNSEFRKVECGEEIR